MKNLKSNIILVAIIVALSFFLFKQCSDKAQLKTLYTASQADVKIWTDKTGRSVAETQALKMDYSLFKEAHANIVDSLKKAGIKGKPKQVVTVTRTISDTLYIRRDPRGLITASDLFTKIWQPDSGRIAYSIYDSLAAVTYKQRYGFLGLKTRTVTRITNTNPNVRMKGASSYEIAPPDKRVGLGFFAGYGAGRDGLTPLVGVGLYYRIF